MGFLKRRTKLISFRLSEEEYEQLGRACIGAGARSISDFARTALRRTVVREGANHTDNSLGDGTQELIDAMKDLSRQVGQLVGLAQSNKIT